MEEPLISVIIPVYKVEQYLDRCLKSVVNQTYKNLEIILVDDGSPDNCPQMCDEWAKKDSRVSVIHKENHGLGAARNSGIDASTGDYITFIDSDDWISDDYVEHLYQHLVQAKADMAIGGYVKTDTYSNEIFTNKENVDLVLTQKEFLLKLMKINTQENVQYAWGRLQKNFRSTSIRFPEDVIDEDVPTTFEYAVKECSKVAMFSKPIYAYFENNDSILRQKFTRKRFDLITVWERAYQIAKQQSDKEIKHYAKLCVYRANFGVLCNICTKSIDESDADYINEHEKKALEVVKKHRKELLSLPMPVSRKTMVLAFCCNYNAVKSISHKLKIRVNV